MNRGGCIDKGSTCQAVALRAPETIDRRSLMVSHLLSRSRLVGDCLGLGENFFMDYLVCKFKGVTGNLAVKSIFVTRRSTRDTSKFQFFSFFEPLFDCSLYHGNEMIPWWRISAGGERSTSKSTSSSGINSHLRECFLLVHASRRRSLCMLTVVQVWIASHCDFKLAVTRKSRPCRGTLRVLIKQIAA